MTNLRTIHHIILSLTTSFLYQTTSLSKLNTAYSHNMPRKTRAQTRTNSSWDRFPLEVRHLIIEQVLQSSIDDGFLWIARLMLGASDQLIHEDYMDRILHVLCDGNFAPGPLPHCCHTLMLGVSFSFALNDCLPPLKSILALFNGVSESKLADIARRRDIELRARANVETEEHGTTVETRVDNIRRLKQSVLEARGVHVFYELTKYVLEHAIKEFGSMQVRA